MKYIFYFLMVMLTSCSLAPTYHRPTENIVPVCYKEMGGWLKAKPQCASLDRGSWWELYQDPELTMLEEKLTKSNENIKAAVARYDQARAALNVARSDYFPTINGVANANRQSPSQSVQTIGPTVPSTYSDVMVGANVSYEIDVWARVRNSVAAAGYLATARAADVSVVRLSMQAELANDYFSLRSADRQKVVLDETVQVYQQALELTQRRYRGGATPVTDVSFAQNQLEAAKTQAADIRLRRAQLEHAIAVLVGEPPACFSIKPIKFTPPIVTIAPNLPTTLLERRPDIAEAELKVESANANIGVARAAFFPAFNFWSSIGYESSSFSNLIQAPSLVWSLGPSGVGTLLNNGALPLVTQWIFDGGKISALSDNAKAKYMETVAQYRQTVLTAYQEVEDNLVAIRQLDKERHTQLLATEAAERAYQQAMYRYKDGLTTYLDVVYSQNLALQSRLALYQVQTRRTIASVQLIRALGGGWSVLNS